MSCMMPSSVAETGTLPPAISSLLYLLLVRIENELDDGGIFGASPVQMRVDLAAWNALSICLSVKL
jgi:hypothetical protein